MNSVLIHVTSFEFDNSLFSSDYYTSERAKDLVRMNEQLFTELAKSRDNYTQAFTFIGAYSQDPLSVPLTAITQVAKQLKAEFDPLLMADVYNDLPYGTAYYQATQAHASHNPNIHAQWPEDPSKITILYAQLHKMAIEHPDAQITFDFYEGNKVICDNLLHFMHKHPELIPHNINLRINHYQNGTLSQHPPVVGKGPTDSNFRQTVKDMHHVLIQSNEKETQANHSISVNLHHLKHRVASVPEHSFFIKSLNQLQAKALSLLSQGEENSGKQVIDLCHFLLQEWNKYLNRECSMAEFKLHCGTALHQARSELESVDITDDLTQMLSAVASLNIIFKNATHTKTTAAPFLFFWQKPEKQTTPPEHETTPKNTTHNKQ